ncbi:MAG: indolepyruvate ferredoxin oxidoreductase family protein, partial [Alphaproteobacteria bacterium]|nr:indolepyruvate ferredoxin oxidoreductase family protein [Alphaproteobacteria bacterium]
EDLAATAIWGSQQVGLFPGAKYDGVFAMWYGKGPGVDRSGDALKHANNAGTAPHGGVLALAGDDHTCRSSTLPHQSDHAFADASMPVLNPAGVQDVIDLGLYGIAMSRYSGCWVGFKTVAETVETSASVAIDPLRLEILTPTDFEMPEGGLNIRWPDPPNAQEYRLHRYKLYAALAFARANKLDRVTISAPAPRFGIVTTGKSYLDVRQALDDLGIDEAYAAEIGLTVYKVAMAWPLEPEGARAFSEGLEEILVVEEKRAVIENQLKEQLYNWDAAVRPKIIGKFDEEGEWILPSAGALTPARIARVIAKRIARFHTSPRIDERLAFLDAKEKALDTMHPAPARIPYFCSGCPHNTSTKVPEGSRAMAGIGCHYMAQWMDRRTDTYTQMGAEGTTWTGQAPFTEEKHVFVNIGDGTYFHSGILAVRQAVASGANITYKILFNDAVAMTGGQPVDGPMTVPQISNQLYGEGVARTVVVTDEPDKYPIGTGWAPGVKVHHRDELDHIQKQLRDIPGVTAIIYDQTCATEKRRRRKRGIMEDPARRAFINEAVCEGCGDCSLASNCLSVVPVETEFGRKRTIDQSACNKDFSCVNGFCPSFVTVEGGSLRKPDRKSLGGEVPFPVLPEPELPALDAPYGILVTGIGGTGVVTVAQLLGMAAHIEDRGVGVLDIAGLAQKFGAVTSHVRIAPKPEDIHAVQIAAGGANLVIGCDLVVTAGAEALGKMQNGTTRAVVNTHETVTGDFTRNPDFAIPADTMRGAIDEAIGDGASYVAATRLANALIGDSIGANLFTVGYAWQKGLIPIGHEALMRAIEVNGMSVESNKQAFLWGRRAAHDLAAVEALVASSGAAPEPAFAETLDDILARRVEYLTRYQDAAYAKRYADFVAKVRATGHDDLTEAVARNYFKLLAIKDEYEVARLYRGEEFQSALERNFEGDYKLRVHLAPPLITRRNLDTGHLEKMSFGPWVFGVFGLLAGMKGLRGTAFDIFGYSAERKAERQLILDYEKTVADLLDGLSPGNHALAAEIASIPDHIRGYGHVKEAAIEKAKAREAELMAEWKNPTPKADAAE